MNLTLAPMTVEQLEDIRFGLPEKKPMRREVLAAIALAALGTLPGCTVALGGATVQQKETVLFVEPGAAVEIATDTPIKVRAVDDTGTEAYASKNLAGFIALPKSVYQKYLDNWNATHPTGGGA